MRFFYLAGISITTGILFSCKTPKMYMAIPDRFKEQADRMPVNGIGNGTGRKEISFGSYKTSRIKRGWNFTTSREDRNTNVTTEERLLRVFKVEKKSITSTQKDKFSFTILDGNNSAQVYALERKVAEETRVTTNNRWLSEFSDPKKFQYSFSAVILPQSVTQPQTWSLLLYSSHENKPGQKPFQMPDIQEGGILASEKDTIAIKMINVQNMINDKGAEVRFPFPMPMAYEFRIDDGVSAILDTWGKVIWIYKELDEQTKFVIAAASSAILLRRIQNSVGLG
jgi:hypothetical protein